MPVKCQSLINLIEEYAPKTLAETWDNVGLQLGEPARAINRVLVTLDVNDEVVNEAVEGRFDIIVSHHPLIFSPIKNIRFDLPVGRNIATLLANQIMLYVAHTNLDSAEKGVNSILADTLSLSDVEILSVSNEEEMVKIVVFVPVGHEDAVREAMSAAGAGWIGNYSECTFQVSGKGTFKALSGANPYLGKVGMLERADEVRIETIMPKSICGRVIKAMIKAHPYEEVAYDLYPMLNKGKKYGLGRIGYLEQPITLSQLAEKVKAVLKVEHVRVGGPLDKEIKKLALCGGSGASFIHKALFAGADAYLTGDLKYHEAQDALAMGLAFIDGGHYATEQIIVPVLAQYLKEKAQQQKLDIVIEISKTNRDPFMFI